MVEKEFIYQRAMEKWGINKQAVVAIEELSELTKELTKLLRQDELDKPREKLYDVDWNPLLEEIADVEVMLDQLKWFVPKGKKLVDEIKERNLRRVSKWLDEEVICIKQ